MTGNLRQSSQLRSSDYRRLYSYMRKLRGRRHSGTGLEAVEAAWRAASAGHSWRVVSEAVRSRAEEERVAVLPSFVMALGAAAVAKIERRAVVAWWDADDLQRSDGSLRYAQEERLALVVMTVEPLPQPRQDFQHHGIPVITADAADAVAILRVAQEAVFRARLGGGPSHIRCVRVDETDPLTVMERFLEGKGLRHRVAPIVK